MSQSFYEGAASSPDPRDAFTTTARAVPGLIEVAIAPLRPPSLTGSLFGDRYRIGPSLGAGATGVVYEAFDETLARTVAIKMLTADLAEPDWLLREARTMAALDHRHVVRVYEAGEIEGIPYLTMAIVDGGPLDTSTPRTPVRAAEVAVSIAEAVDDAHRHGILHRDLKPGNVLVDRATGEPVVTDFGHAARLDLAADAHACGTPPYMAPEVWRDEPGAASIAADVWSLGVLLHEMLGGRRPFDADTVHDLRSRVLHDPPPPLPGIPRDLAAICLRCLEKDPARRYATAGALAGDLRRFLRHEETEARPHGPFERFGHRVVRRPGITIPALLAILAVTQTVRQIHTRQRAEIAEMQAKNAEMQTRNAEMEAARARPASYAHDLADRIIEKMRHYRAAVEEAAKRPDVARVLGGNAPSFEAASKVCAEIAADPGSEAARDFSLWFLFDRTGALVGRSRKPHNPTLGKDYAWRDYWTGAEAAEQRGRPGAYVSRVYRSEGDDHYELGVSVRLHDDQGFAGLLVATLSAGSGLGSIQLDPGGEGFTPAVLADRDRERPDRELRPEQLFFLLPGLPRGEARLATSTEVLGSGVAHTVKVPDTPFTVIVRADAPPPSAR